LAEPRLENRCLREINPTLASIVSGVLIREKHDLGPMAGGVDMGDSLSIE
jgi:hypothetical protein